MRASQGAEGAAGDAGRIPDDTHRLYNAEETIELMGLKGRKTARWLLDKARADQLFYTPVGKTPMWSTQDMRDNVRRMRHTPRNAFVA